ncbi:MAG TPA: leucyl/phenylalanyl-tRNA--protein transferase [Phycisphaerae bacterium]|nr:leucyl/phenylalanyl-tRNA--protein transferase [Phycisphaerae bacterium]
MDELPLTPQVLVAAYANGIFPMDVEGRIAWFCPDPRTIIDLDRFHVPGNIAQRYRNRHFEIRVDTCFEEVIRSCAELREETWISAEIVEAYIGLHRLGPAHSVESWRGGELAGGLYGVALGGAFFGESMFHRQTDASKVALVALVERLKARGFVMLDVQFTTPHLERFGAVEIPRDEYLKRLGAAIELPVKFVD